MIAETIAVLRAAGVELTDPLSDGEINRVQDLFGFTFAPDHRAFLQTALPVGDRWCDWRNGDSAALSSIVTWPIEGVLFDVENNVFWPESWGERSDDADQVAREQLALWPTLIPLYGHRFMLGGSGSAKSSAVYSVHQSDAIIYGVNLLEYARREFGQSNGLVENHPLDPANPWDLLAFNLDVP